MSASAHPTSTPTAAPLLAIAGLALAVGAWMLPANLKSVSPALLKAAGSGTPTLSGCGKDLVEAEKIGPAELVLAAARAAGDPGAPDLARSLARLAARQPSFVAWGGWDPALDPVFDLRTPSGHAESTPVLTFLIPEKARARLLAALSNSGSLGVQDLLKVRDLPSTGRFVPATKPGGQPLDALLLLTALLYQGDRLSPPLQRELRGLAEDALEKKDLGALEPFLLDLLSLGRRLDWGQLRALLQRTDGTRAVSEYSQLARVAPDRFALIYAAALLTGSADRVASYLIEFGEPGAEDLRLALSDGQGAARLLVAHPVPVNRTAGPALGAAAALVLAHPQLMLAAKYLGYFLGLFLILRGLDRWAISPAGAGGSGASVPHVRAGLLAFLLAGLVVAATEPYLLKAAPASGYRPVVRIPMLAIANGAPPPSPTSTTHIAMDASTLLSIGVFALIQVVMYAVCLRKIDQINREDRPPLLKLRLMENEENLFDSGLYVGMMGTAAALVLQVLGVIQPNLLAAYSSNLFGIVCVALVKIRHVRGFKRRLILENEAIAAAKAT
jgi:hypothetical protein